MVSATSRDLGYIKISRHGFAETVAAVVAGAEALGFKVQHVHDVSATLAGKGFPRPPLQIVEVCNAHYASQALGGDVAVSLFMPCKINVYEQDGQVVVNALRPALLAEFFPAAGLEGLAAEVDAVICHIVDDAV